MLKNLFGSSIFVDSAHHVAWYNVSTLYQLGQRHGLALDCYTGINVANPQMVHSRLFFNLDPVLIKLGLGAGLFANSIIFEFVRA